MLLLAGLGLLATVVVYRAVRDWRFPPPPLTLEEQAHDREIDRLSQEW